MAGGWHGNASRVPYWSGAGDSGTRARRAAWTPMSTPAAISSDTAVMATVTTHEITRSGPAVRQALVEHGGPGDAERFAAEMRAALDRAGETLDLAEVERVLARWHALATMAINPLDEEETAQLARARAGDLAGLRARTADGEWVTL